MSQPSELLETDMPTGEEASPRHGFQGDRGAAQGGRFNPLGLAISVSRESGARGGAIARRVAGKLGWQVYDRELLEYMAQDPVVRQGVLETLTPAAAVWIETQLVALKKKGCLGGDETGFEHMARLVLALGAVGDVVLIGRGAGCILPRETTLNVRVVAPLSERIAYMAQWMRMTTAEAAERVRSRDEGRAEFLGAHFGQSPADVHYYHLVLNSSLLGEDACADLIGQAAHIRWTAVVEGRR